MFMGPDRAVEIIDHQSLRVSMAIAEDFRECALPIDKRVIQRSLAVSGQADDGSRMGAEVLRSFPQIEAITEREQQGSVFEESDSSAVMHGAIAPGLFRKDDSECRESPIVQPGSGQAG